MSTKKEGDSESGHAAKKYTMAIAVRLSGVESHRIRRFEEGGLLVPERTSGNQRLFSDEDVEVIGEAATLEDEGINVEGIKAILAIRTGDRR